MPELNIWIYSLISVFAISLVSLMGIIVFSLNYVQLKKILIYLVSFSAGVLFAGALLHLLPELIEKEGFSLNISIFILVGIVLFFILEKLIHWHHHHIVGEDSAHPFSIMILIFSACFIY